MARREIRQRLIVAVGLAEGQRPVGIGGREIGVDLNRLVEIRNRVAVAPHPRIGGATGVIGAGIVGVALDHIGQGRDVDLAGPLRVLLHHGDAPHGASAGGVAGGQAETDEDEGEGCETANRWGEHLRLQLKGREQNDGEILTGSKRMRGIGRLKRKTAPRFRRGTPI